ncbi:hypothetical protein C8R44DRAFT_989466 [Mycena epipterygia]|nr:hypothetical protein C8R44DRAFT_989466 [Mycena epipterygia]
MQFNVVLIATALLVSASPVMSATITFFNGAGCTGSVITVSSGPGECISVLASSAKSITYSGVPTTLTYFTGANCTGSDINVIIGPGECIPTPAAGFNFESVSFS